LNKNAGRRPNAFTTDDGVELRGLWAGGGDLALVLVHEIGRDLDAWGPAPDWLAAEGFRVLLFDLRGHGASDGEESPVDVATDVTAAITAARNESRVVIVVCAGDAADGTIAAALQAKTDGLVLVSPEFPLEERARPERTLMPSLAILDKASEQWMARVRQVQSGLIGWRMIVHAGTDEHGSAMLSGKWASHAHEHIRSFARQTARAHRS
jgi:pimeloyl-ACP methyl ester carboxylesterase